MKTLPKTKRPIKRFKKLTKTASKSVFLVHAKHPLLRYFRLINHKHTGRLIHRRHTSHLILMAMLLIVGLLLYVSAGFAQVRSWQMTSSGNVSVGVIVPGPAPTVGAVITTPVDGANFTDEKIINVMGTCARNTFVVVQDNNKLAGSTVCTEAGIFELQIQLQSGKNVLSSLNYDNLNQSGPATKVVTIYVTPTIIVTEVTEPILSAPTLPTNPSIIPGVSSNPSNCDSYNSGDLPTGGEPHVEIVCVPRLFGSGLQQVMGILAWGGSPPYAININGINDSDDNLMSMPSPGYKKVLFSYANVGVHKISIKLKDKDDKVAIVQTAIQVNGVTETPIEALANDVLYKSWLETPVPLYVITVALTLGFWCGDLFDRNFGADKRYRRA